MEEYIIRKMRISDIMDVQELESSVFNDPWTVEQFKYEFEENPISTQYVLEINGVIYGFIVFWVTFNSSTICKIAVVEEARNNGVGSILFETMLDDLTEMEVETITLEVRTDNESAIEFYENRGFSKVTTKPQYYADGTDAYYMVKVLI